ncbi:MAG: hypothetical protein GY874_03810 [Desulfobacteraceae bacterium]|nr:hypothetical protein [Desulfobacteraceae bacterium]
MPDENLNSVNHTGKNKILVCYSICENFSNRFSRQSYKKNRLRRFGSWSLPLAALINAALGFVLMDLAAKHLLKHNYEIIFF